MMKNILFVSIILFLFFNGISQVTNSETVLFAQSIVDIENAEEMRALEVEMRSNPYIKIVRLDYNTQRCFVLTKNLDELSETNFISWFNQFSDRVRCIQIGRQGIDIVKSFPFEGCEK
ncbi:MAG: hypothetical protein RI883_1788 [Bacteroidota bacterium]|jgi:hypothetical protein